MKWITLLSTSAAALTGCTQSTGVELSATSRPRHGVLDGGASAITVAVKPIQANWTVTENNEDALLPSGAAQWTYSVEHNGVRTHTATYRVTAAARTDANADAQVWGQQLRSTLMHLLRKHGGRRIEVIESDRIDLLIEERNRKLANLTESAGNPEQMQWSGVDAFVVGDLQGHTTVSRESKPISAAGGYLAGFTPYIGGFIRSELSRPKPRFRRTMTLSGNLRLLNAANGETIAVHQITAQTHEDEKSYPFKDASRMGFVPEEQIIQKLLDDEVRNFCGTLVPVEFRDRYLVKSSSHEDSKLGVGYLRSGQHEQALHTLERATAARPDDHRSHFAAGVAAEKLGRLADARAHYRSAVLSVDTHKIEPGDYEAQYQRALRNAEARQ